MKLRSPVFEDFKAIPSEFTADGVNQSPPFIISEVPVGAKSLAIICHDPDASSGGDWLHWIAWDIDPKITGLSQADALGAATVGNNDFKTTGYGGPAPHPGSGEHRYVFELYALDKKLNLAQNSDRESLELAMAGHILAQSTWTGVYERK